MSIVTLADNGVGQRIQNPRPLTASSVVEIARILFQKRWQNGASKERPCDNISIRCAEALGITLYTLPITAPPISCLVKSCNHANRNERDRIHRRLPGQPEL